MYARTLQHLHVHFPSDVLIADHASGTFQSTFSKTDSSNQLVETIEKEFDVKCSYISRNKWNADDGKRKHLIRLTARPRINQALLRGGRLETAIPYGCRRPLLRSMRSRCSVPLGLRKARLCFQQRLREDPVRDHSR